MFLFPVFSPIVVRVARLSAGPRLVSVVASTFVLPCGVAYADRVPSSPVESRRSPSLSTPIQVLLCPWPFDDLEYLSPIEAGCIPFVLVCPLLLMCSNQWTGVALAHPSACSTFPFPHDAAPLVCTAGPSAFFPLFSGRLTRFFPSDVVPLFFTHETDPLSHHVPRLIRRRPFVLPFISLVYLGQVVRLGLTVVCPPKAFLPEFSLFNDLHAMSDESFSHLPLVSESQKTELALPRLLVPASPCVPFFLRAGQARLSA